MIKTLSLVLVACLLALALSSPSSATNNTESAGKVTEYVRSLQNPDGGFPAFGASSDPGATLDASFAFISAGIDPRGVTRSGNSPVDFLSAQAAVYSGTAGGAAKLALGVAGIRLDARAFAGVDLIARMESHYAVATGKYGSDLFVQSLFILAEAALGRPVPPAALAFLKASQSPDGGFAFSPPGDSDTNTTSLAVQALIAGGAPASDAAITGALAYLRSAQSTDGGFPFAPPGDSDPNSTAFVIQAIVAAGRNPAEGGDWDMGGGKAPLPALLSFQNASTGAFQFFGEDSPFASYQALPALLLKPFPLTLSQPTPSPISTASPTPTPTGSPSPTATPTPTVSALPTPTATASPAPPATPIPSAISPTLTPAATARALPGTGGERRRDDGLPVALLVLVAGLGAIGVSAGITYGGRRK